MNKISDFNNFFSIKDGFQWGISVGEKNKENHQGGSFGDQLIGFIKEINNSQNQASNLQNDYIAGKKVEPHELMMSMEKAGMMLNLSVHVKDHLVKTWNDLTKMA